MMHALVVVGAFLSWAAPSASAAKTVERVVAVVNDDIILESEVDQLAVTQLRGNVDVESAEGKKAFDEVRHKALDSLIDSQLMRQQATELKLNTTTEEVDRAVEGIKKQNKLDDTTFVEALKQQGFTLESFRKNMKKQILEMKVVNTAVRSRINISDDEVKAYYNQNVAKMSGDTEAKVRMILLAVAHDAPAADVERKRKTAEKVVGLARAGKSFVELAKAFSDDDLTKGDGGDLGWVGKGILVDELEQAMQGMLPGDVRGPVRTARGWHVLQVTERKAGDVRPLDEAKDQIRQLLSEQQMEKGLQSFLRELRKRSHLDIRL